MVRQVAIWSGIITLSVCFSAGVRPGLAGAEQQTRASQKSGWEKVWDSPGFEAKIRSLSGAIDIKRMSSSLFHLAKDPLPYRKLNLTLPGHVKSTLEEADDFIAGQLESWGYSVQREAVRVQAFRRDVRKPKQEQYSPPMPGDPWYTAHNLYAERKGRSHPDEIILLLAHKDSQSWIDSPGANDNAIGTVSVLEIACLLARHTPERTVRFLFCNEEHTPWTSVTAAQNARKRGDRIIAVFNLDGVGGKTAAGKAGGKPTNVTAYTRPEGAWLAELMSAVNARFAVGLDQQVVRRTSPGDDDGSFVNAGYTAAIINIGSWPYGDPNYHAEGDIPENSDVPNAAKVVQATLAAVLTVDQSAATPGTRGSPRE
jgi:hypothetical protein